MGRALLLAFLLCSGCAVRPREWRLVKQDSGHVLIPPDVRKPDLRARTLRIGGITEACAAGGPVVAAKNRVTISRAGLANQPAGWLASWAAQLERNHCLPPGDGLKLATHIAESVPLDPAIAFRLLHPDERRAAAVDVGPRTRLQVLSPLWREPDKGMIEGPLEISGTSDRLTVTAKSNDNLLGYEKTIYAVQPNSDRAGYAIVPLYSDRYLTANAASERHTRPSTEYFQFPPEAAFYRLFYESWRTDFSAIVIVAPTPAELEERTAKLEAEGESASCRQLDRGMCIQIPRDVAVNPLIPINVNGAELLFFRGATLRNAIAAGGEQRPESVLPRLTFLKSWNGRMMPVAFDRTDLAILAFPLYGGEIISWR